MAGSRNTPLRAWRRLTEHATWECFADVRDVYPHADQVGRCIVFNIPGNKFRLAVVIHFNRGKVYIRPEMALLMRSRLVIALPDDRMVTCPLLHIASVETLQSVQ